MYILCQADSIFNLTSKQNPDSSKFIGNDASKSSHTLYCYKRFSGLNALDIYPF